MSTTSYVQQIVEVLDMIGLTPIIVTCAVIGGAIYVYKYFHDRA